MNTSEQPEPTPPNSWRVALQAAGPYLGLGAQLAGAMAVFTFGGYLLDQWLGLTPWLTIAGAALGLVAVFVQVFRASSEMSRSSRPKNSSEPRRDR